MQFKTTGCLGVNKVSDMLASFKDGKYQVQLARLDTVSLNGSFVKRIKPAMLEKLNNKPNNWCSFKTLGSDVTTTPTLADWLTSEFDYVCGNLSNFRLGLHKTSQTIEADLEIMGPMTKHLTSLLEDGDQYINFGMCTFVEHVKNHLGTTSTITDILGFKVIGTFKENVKEIIGVNYIVDQAPEFV